MFRIPHTHTRSRERPPTPASSYTHAREPRQSALSTFLPLRPSNYQSEGRRRPAALSGLSSTRDGRETAATIVRLQRHDGRFNKAPYFSPHETSSFLLNLSSPRSQIHQKYSFKNLTLHKNVKYKDYRYNKTKFFSI